MSRRRQPEPCLKLRFGTEALAQEALRNIAAIADRSPFRHEQRFYQCPDCKGFHLTSQAVMAAYERH